MKNNYIILILCFSISFIQISSDDKISAKPSMYEICQEGKYGDDCNLNCTCDLKKWASSKNCSRIDGRCLDCKFGHFDKNCENICYPTCKTNLCCSIESKSFKTSNKKINSNIETLKIKIGNTTLNIYPDYNVGYPLTLFKKVEGMDCSGIESETFQYSNNIKVVNAIKCDNTIITIENDDKNNFSLNLTALFFEGGVESYDGVIGLGFSNGINYHLMKKKEISLNIASYKIKNEKVNILFGNIFNEERKFVNTLSYCDALVENKTNHTVMKCKVEGMRYGDFSDALKLNNIEIYFSLHENTSFVLPNESHYLDYINKYYFNNKGELKDTGKKIYLCYPNKKINKLNDFGFVINKYYYSYKADQFFSEDKDICDNNYRKFLIEFANDANEAKIVFGKTLLKDIEFTIDNEERKIYFYSKHAKFFSGKFTEKGSNDFSLSFDPLTSSLVTIGIIFLMNVISFLIYFYFKRKKSK